MSGGEIAGLALGTVALASLFQTCIDLLEYVEAVKDYENDRDIATVKLSLLHERLRSWGADVRILEQGNEDLTLREQSESVRRGLLRLKQLLASSELLFRKHELAETSRSVLMLRRRTSWAVHDKKKFEKLIQDIAFIMDNLQKVTKSTKVTLQTSETVRREQVATSAPSRSVTGPSGPDFDRMALRLRDGGRIADHPPNDGTDKSNEDMEAQFEASRSGSHAMPPKDGWASTFGKSYVISGHQQNKNQSFALLGAECTVGTAVISGRQDNEGGGFAVVGVVGEGVICNLYKEHLRSEAERTKLSEDLAGTGAKRG